MPCEIRNNDGRKEGFQVPALKGEEKKGGAKKTGHFLGSFQRFQPLVERIKYCWL